MRILSGLLLLAVTAGASPDVVQRANALYQRTEYEDSLHVLAEDPAPDAADYLLSGKNYFMLGDYKKAIEFFEKALALSPSNSDYELWLGRAWGRRAETSGWLMAGVHASKARQCFERAVALDPHNREAKNDLFDFYLNAPGFLGGGIGKSRGASPRASPRSGLPNTSLKKLNSPTAGKITPRQRRICAAPWNLRPMKPAGSWIWRDTSPSAGVLPESDRAVRASQKTGAQPAPGCLRRSQGGYRKPSQPGAGARAAARAICTPA